MDIENFLKNSEIKYGGECIVRRNKISQHDPRTKEILDRNNMRGGDRMTEKINNYAPIYSKYLSNMENEPSVIVEIGVLNGTGLAIWSDLFPDSRVVGLDIDLSHYWGNKQTLENLGAFKNNNVEVYEFDQLHHNNNEILSKIFSKEKIQFLIDDGLHLNESILNSINDFLPFLDKHFLYVVEDNKVVYDEIARIYSDKFNVFNEGKITILQGRRSDGK